MRRVLPSTKGSHGGFEFFARKDEPANLTMGAQFRLNHLCLKFVYLRGTDKCIHDLGNQNATLSSILLRHKGLVPYHNTTISLRLLQA